MRLNLVTTLSLIAATSAMLVTGCTVERAYDNYGGGSETINDSFAAMRYSDATGVLLGQLGPLDIDAPADVDVYDAEPGYTSVNLNSYPEGNWGMAGLNFSGGSLSDLELGRTYTFNASSYGSDDIAVEGIGCSSTTNGMDGFDEPLEEIEVLVEEGEQEGELEVMFTGSFYDGAEVDGAFEMTEGQDSYNY